MTEKTSNSVPYASNANALIALNCPAIWAAAVLFSRRAVVAPYGDSQALMFRIVNRRRNEIIQLEAQVLFSAMTPDDRGGMTRRYTLLPLERNKVTFFPLSWTVVHPIDDASPLAGQTRETLERREGEILVLLTLQ